MEQLSSLAEKNALKCNELNNFKDFNLISFKNEIKEILDLIGRNSIGVFLTYTKHDISHINAMLDIAEWLIVNNTKSKMTCVDWLMLTLACYLHDLGMVTTDMEFSKRNESLEFRQFKNRILTDPAAEDYKNRVSSDKNIDQEKFYFQEFIRSTHARRVKEWIQGVNLERWEQSIGVIPKHISESLKKLPPRFINSLGIVCESHHKDDLHDESKYPLYETYGSSKEESANIQYAGIILRTLDLLHITKDRTPSITFRSLNITDPIGILEWEKQIGTYAVLPISRVFKEDDVETHIISVTADFKEERPFFTLSEYLSYADLQIKQSKAWIDKSVQNPDGEGFYFPWHSIKGNIKVEGNNPIPLRFELDRGKLLDLLVGHTIYNDPTVVIRELLQNSIDAIRYRMYTEKEKYKSPKIEVRWNTHTREVIILDNGIGMDKLIITNHLMKVGSSFYNTPEFLNNNTGFSPISKFGIGILTCFMVSDDIEILTKKGRQGYRIRMTSVHSNYLLKELASEHPDLDPIQTDGTIVKLRLRPSVDVNKRAVRDILKYWIIFPPCKVVFIEDNEDEEEIGFGDTEEAFHYFYIADKLKENSGENIKIVSNKKVIGKESYEISFGIDTSFLDMPSLIPRKNIGPVVCLEGIRVLNEFPILTTHKRNISLYNSSMEYGRDASIAAIISIKNNSNLRTTVSRDGLEFDDAYLKIGGICLELLFNYIGTEVERIKELPGKPYSRASTAVEWMVRDIHKTFKGEIAIKQIEEKQSAISSIVIEEILNDKLIRNLVSKEAFLKYDSFWTIESRLLNYLGTLSRDLGRELGFNTFIERLAPDLLNRTITPLLIEHTLFDLNIFKSYKPVKTIYSEKYQQVSIEWKKGTNETNAYEDFLSDFSPYEIERKVNELFAENIIRDNSFYYDLEFTTSSERSIIYYSFSKVYESEIIGDRKDIKAVINNRNILLSKDSIAYSTWRSLLNLLDAAISKDNSDDVCIVLGALYLFYKSCLNKIGNNSRFGSDDKPDLFWSLVYPKLIKLFDKFGFKNDLRGANISMLTGNEHEWFTPSKYWFDRSKYFN